MRPRLTRLISIIGWAGVVLDSLLLILTVVPGGIWQWALRPLSALLPHRRAIDAVAFALLLAADLLDGASRAGAALPRLADPPLQDGEWLRWQQPRTHFRNLDWFGRAFVLHAGALPALFVAAAALFLLLAPARLPLFFVAILAYFPARYLGRWAAMRWLTRALPDTAGLSTYGVTAVGMLLPWEALSCFSVDARSRILVFPRPFPRPPLLALTPPEESRERVLDVLHERLPEVTVVREAWRRQEAALVARLSAPLLVACAAVAGAFFLHDRLLACAGLALTFWLCHQWFWRLAGSMMQPEPAPQPDDAAQTCSVATQEPAMIGEPLGPLSRWWWPGEGLRIVYGLWVDQQWYRQVVRPHLQGREGWGLFARATLGATLVTIPVVTPVVWVLQPAGSLVEWALLCLGPALGLLIAIAWAAARGRSERIAAGLALCVAGAPIFALVGTLIAAVHLRGGWTVVVGDSLALGVLWGLLLGLPAGWVRGMYDGLTSGTPRRMIDVAGDAFFFGLFSTVSNIGSIVTIPAGIAGFMGGYWPGFRWSTRQAVGRELRGPRAGEEGL